MRLLSTFWDPSLCPESRSVVCLVFHCSLPWLRGAEWDLQFTESWVLCCLASVLLAAEFHLLGWRVFLLSRASSGLSVLAREGLCVHVSAAGGQIPHPPDSPTVEAWAGICRSALLPVSARATALPCPGPTVGVSILWQPENPLCILGSRRLMGICPGASAGGMAHRVG